MPVSRGYFRFGAEGLDKLLRGVLTSGTLVVIAGHPGSGKTSLASTMCYSNALEGHKCLYVSLQESKDKLFSNMRRLGLDLHGIEKKGLLHFVKFPLVADPETVLDVTQEMGDLVAKTKPKVLVLDTITPLLKAVNSNVKARAILQNFFAELPKIMNGIVVLLAEVPVTEEKIEAGDMEFVADVILVLRHKIERDLLIRDLEVRKARGAPVVLARVPFTIIEGKGINVYAPVVLEEIPTPRTVELAVPCRSLGKYLGYFQKGQIIYITYPPDARPVPVYLHFTSLAAVNNLRCLIVSYKSSSQELRGLMVKSLEDTGIKREVATELIDKHFIIKGINPVSMGSSQLGLWEIDLIKKVAPDAVIFHGVDIVANVEDPVQYRVGLLNQLLHLKNLGLLTVRMGSYGDRYYNWHALLADIVFKLRIYEEGNTLKYSLYLWKRGKLPVVLGLEELRRCHEEVAEALKKVLSIGGT